MTTTKNPEGGVAPPNPVPATLTDEHHEAILRSWELPAYARPTEPAKTSNKALYAGLIAGAIGLALGAVAGYWVGSENASTAEAPAPIVITVPINPDAVNPATDFGARRVESTLAAPPATDFGARRVESPLLLAVPATDPGARRVES
jgi:hypothetical protein